MDIRPRTHITRVITLRPPGLSLRRDGSVVVAVVAVVGGVGAIRSSNRLALPPFAPKLVSTLNRGGGVMTCSVEQDVVGADTREDTYINVYNGLGGSWWKDCVVRALFASPKRRRYESVSLDQRKGWPSRVFSKRKNTKIRKWT